MSMLLMFISLFSSFIICYSLGRRIQVSDINYMIEYKYFVHVCMQTNKNISYSSPSHEGKKQSKSFVVIRTVQQYL